MDADTDVFSISLPTTSSTEPTDVTSPTPYTTMPPGNRSPDSNSKVNSVFTTSALNPDVASPLHAFPPPTAPAAPSTTFGWDTSCLANILPFTGPAMACFGAPQPQIDLPGPSRPMEEACRRSLPHFPSAAVQFPMPTLDFDFRVAVTLKPESSRLEGKPGNNAAPREIVAVSDGKWSASFGNGRILTGGYDLGQARGFRPIRILEGVFIMQTTDDPPAILEMRTRGSLSGPCDVLDALLAPRQTPKTIDPRRYGFRMFSTIKTADKRYTETVNCGLWVASGVWRGDELIMDAYRVT